MNQETSITIALLNRVSLNVLNHFGLGKRSLRNICPNNIAPSSDFRLYGSFFCLNENALLRKTGVSKFDINGISLALYLPAVLVPDSQFLTKLSTF